MHLWCRTSFDYSVLFPQCSCDILVSAFRRRKGATQWLLGGTQSFRSPRLGGCSRRRPAACEIVRISHAVLPYGRSVLSRIDVMHTEYRRFGSRCGRSRRACTLRIRWRRAGISIACLRRGRLGDCGRRSRRWSPRSLRDCSLKRRISLFL